MLKKNWNFRLKESFFFFFNLQDEKPFEGVREKAKPTMFINKKSKLINLTKYVDGIIAFIVLFGLLVDLFYKFDYPCFAWVGCFLEKFKNTEYASIILIALLPLIMTIVSIVVSFPKNRVCGISINKFQKICNYRYYNLPHIFIVTIFLFIFYFVFYIFDLMFSVIVLEGATIFFCLIFGIHELQIFINDKPLVRKLIKCKYTVQQTRTIDEKDNDSKENLFNILLRNYVVTYGINNLYESLISIDGCDNEITRKTNRTKILIDLINLKYNYFKKIIRMNGNDTNGILNSLVCIYLDDLHFVFTLRYSTDIFKSGDDFIFKNLMLAHNLCVRFNILDTEKKNYKFIFSLLLLKKINLHFLIKMFIASIKNGDPWLLEYYRDYLNDGLFKEEAHLSYEIFITMIIIYLLENSVKNKGNRLLNFFNEPVGGYQLLNTQEAVNDSWGRIFFDYVANCALGDIFHFYSKTLELYNSLDSLNKYLSVNKLLKNRDSSFELFSKKTISRYWVYYLFMNANFEVDECDPYLKEFTDEQKSLFAEALGDLPKDFDETSYTYKLYNFMKQDKRKVTDLINKIDEDVEIEAFESENDDNKNKELLIKLKKDLKQIIDKKIKNNEFYDDSIKGLTKKRNYRYLIKSDNILDVPNKFNGNGLSKLIDRLIDDYLRNWININRSNLNVNNNLQSDYKKREIGNINLNYKDGAIKFNALIKESSVKIERPKDDEYIKDYIFSVYKRNEDGLYKFIENDYCYFLTEEKLINKLKSLLFVVYFEVEYSIVVNVEDCFLKEGRTT